MDDLADPVLDPELRDGWRLVSAAAVTPPTSAELAGLESALEHFRAAVPLSTVEARQGRRAVMIPSTLGARLGVAAAGAVLLGFGGLSAAALSGSLPGGERDSVRPAGALPAAGDLATQPAADDPEDQGGVTPTGAPTTAVGPDATGPAAFGLCNAYAHRKDAGKAADRSVAFRNLVTAAGGEDGVEAYCAAVEHPSARGKGTATDAPKGKSTDAPKGKSTDAPKGKSTDAPKGKSTDAPQGKPTDAPQGKPAGAGKASTTVPRP